MAERARDLGKLGERLEGHDIICLAGTDEIGMHARRLEAGEERLGRTELQAGIAPLQLAYRREPVIPDPFAHLRVEWWRLARDAEAAVLGIASRPAGDLGQLVRLQVAMTPPVELRETGEGDMGDVEVEPHADRIRRNEVIDIAILEKCDLRVAGARAERPHHHRSTPLLAPDELGNRVDIIRRETDDGAARRHPAQLPCPGIGELRETLP